MNRRSLRGCTTGDTMNFFGICDYKSNSKVPNCPTTFYAVKCDGNIPFTPMDLNGDIRIEFPTSYPSDIFTFSSLHLRLLHRRLALHNFPRTSFLLKSRTPPLVRVSAPCAVLI